MVESLENRGPDGSNFKSNTFQNSTIYIGHTHLNILSNKDDKQQPFLEDKNSFCYNGAIYNYQELDDDFKSDAESLFSSIKNIGINETLAKANGMFSFVYSDNENIYIARDSIGIKPIYYYNDANYLIVSSETRAIFETGLIKRTIKKEEALHFLKYKHTSLGNTIFEKVQEVKPQYYLKFNSNGAEEVVYDFNNYSNKNLESTLSKSISQRLKTKDKKVGLFLSGGVDSTIILSKIKEQFPDYDLNTFSLEIEGSNDTSYSQMAAKQFGSTHHSIAIDSLRLDDVFHKNEEPIGDIATITTQLLSKKAKEAGVDVILSGAGADELFAGYNRHKAFSSYLKYNWFPFSILKLLPFAYSDKLRKLKKLGESIGKTTTETFLNFTSTRWDIDIKHSSKIDNIKEALYHDQKHYLVKDILAMTDKMTMKNGIECRLPFLDLNVVKIANEHDNHLKNGSKSLLKSLLTRNGGEAYTKRKKEGFGFTIHPDDVNLVLSLPPEDMIFNYIPYSDVMKKAKAHQIEKENYSQELSTLLILRNTVL